MIDHNVLVTGGSGFIGSYVCKELALNGFHPVVYDVRPPSDITLDWIAGDVVDERKIADAMAEVGAVIHLASLLSVGMTDLRPRETLDTAILGTRAVTRAAHGSQRVVLASSSEVYGEANLVPTPEDATLAPRSVYGIAKLAAEAYVRTCVASSAAHFTVLRYFNVYGPGQSQGFVIPRLVALSLAGLPLTVYGEGNQVRAFTHVTDAARGTVQALRCNAAAGRTYNIGNASQPITIRELARQIMSAAESGNELMMVPFAESDRTAEREIYHRVPDISAAQRDLGYQPVVSLEEGIQSVIHFAKAIG